MRRRVRVGVAHSERTCAAPRLAVLSCWISSCPQRPGRPADPTMARLPRPSQGPVLRRYSACPSSPARRPPPAPPAAPEHDCLCATPVALRQNLTVGPRNLNAYAHTIPGTTVRELPERFVEAIAGQWQWKGLLGRHPCLTLASRVTARIQELIRNHVD